MKRSIAPLLTEAALILLIVGLAVASVVAFDRSNRPAPLSALEKEKISLSRKADALERENRTLRDTVRALEARLAQRENSTDTLARLQAELGELHKRRDRAQTSARAAAAEIAQSRKMLAALDEQLGRKSAQLQTLSKAVARKEAALTKVRDARRKELENLTEQETAAAGRAEAAAAEVVKVRQALGALETTLTALRSERTALSEEIAKNRETLAALTDQLDLKKTHLETTSAAAARKEAALAKARDSRRNALENLEQQEAAAAKRAEAAKTELVRVNQALAAVETTLGERQAELTNMSAEVARLEKVSKQTSRSLTSEIEALKIQRDLVERQVISSKSQAERLGQKVTALQVKVDANQSQLKLLEDSVRQRKAELETLPAPPAAQTPAQLTDRNICLEAWARVAAEPKARARLAKLREKIAAAETELCELNKRHGAAKEKLGSSTNRPSRPQQPQER